jgi:WXG100 family type VII secretion target
MSADVIQARYDNLEAIAYRFAQTHNDILRLQQLLTRSFKPLQDGGWRGRGATAFFAEMNNTVFPASKRLAQALETARAVTLEAKKILETAEQEASAPFKATVVANIKDGLKNAMQGPGTDEAAINRIVDNIPDGARQAVTSDRALMNQLHAELGDQKYLDLVVKLRMNESGTVKQPSPESADAAIQSHLKKYLDQAIKDGRKITGSVAVVGSTEWDIAGKAHYGEPTWTDQKRDRLSGFVDAQGRVWVHKDQGSPGTMLHEAVHKHSSEAMNNTSQPLNEGVTEYFTRDVGKTTTPPTVRTNYQNNFRFAEGLVKLVGEEAVAKGYFDGDMEGLKKAYIKAGKTEADWNKMIEHTSKKEWDDARKLVE